MIRYGSGNVSGPSPVWRVPHIRCSISGVMNPLADPQSVKSGLKPNRSPLQRMERAGLSGDDAFSFVKALRLDAGRS